MDKEARKAFLAARAEKMKNAQGGRASGADRMAQFARGRPAGRGRQSENTSDHPDLPSPSSDPSPDTPTNSNNNNNNNSSNDHSSHLNHSENKGDNTSNIMNDNNNNNNSIHNNQNDKSISETPNNNCNRENNIEIKQEKIHSNEGKEISNNNIKNDSNNKEENKEEEKSNNGSEENKSRGRNSRMLDRRAMFSAMGGKKETKPSDNQLSISKEEILAFALDEALRIYYQLYQENEKGYGNQCVIHRDTSIQLRQLVVELIDSFDHHFKEISFTIPDPSIVKAKSEVKIKEQQENYKMQLLYKKLALDPSFLSIDDSPNSVDATQNQNQNITPNVGPNSEADQPKPSPSLSPTNNSGGGGGGGGSAGGNNNILLVAKDEKTNNSGGGEEGEGGGKEQPVARGRKAMRGAAAALASGGAGRGNRRSGMGGTSQRLANASGRPVLTRDGNVSNPNDDVPDVLLYRNLIDVDHIIQRLTERIHSHFHHFPAPSAVAPLEYYSYTVKGPRASNEDELVVLEHASSFLSPHHSSLDYSFIGVYDGHSGKKASLYSRSQLHYNVFNHPHFDSNMYKAIHDGFLLTDERLTDIQHREKLSCGTTALSVWINNQNREIVVANVGDCRGYFYQNNAPIEICNPHTLQREDEKERVLMSGGGIACVYGTWRVNGTIAVTRSIGDVNIKYLLIPDPEITSFQASDRGDEYLLIASDGLWDVMNFHEVSEFVKHSPSRQNICKLLCEEALTRKSKDNVTIVIVYFNKSSDNS